MMARINTPDEAAAIRNLMASRRRAWRSPAPWPGAPVFVPGKTTTARYVRRFCGEQYAAMFNLAGLNRPAPFYVGPEVTAEEVEEREAA